MERPNISLREVLRRVTCMPFNIIDKLLNEYNDADDKDKERILNHIRWHIPTGGPTTRIDGKPYGAELKRLIVEWIQEEYAGEYTEEEVQALKELFTSGGEIKLKADVTINEVMKPANGATLDLDLNNKTITVELGANGKGQDFLDVIGGSVVTVANGKIVGTLPEVDAAESVFYITKGKLTLDDMEVTGARCVYANNAAAEITINSGVYTTLYSTAPVVYVEKGGKVTINGGTFKADGNVANKYLLNLKDALTKVEGFQATNHICIIAGIFVNFDPSRSESENPTADFVDKDSIVGQYVDGADTIYIVEKYNNHSKTSYTEDGKEITWHTEKFEKEVEENIESNITIE